MKKVLLTTSIALLVCLFVSGAPVQAADNKPVELKIWSAWIPDTFSTDPFMHMFIKKVNEKGKAVNLSVKLVGGPEVFKHTDGFQAMQKGLVDMAWTAAVYHAGVVPEGRAMMLTQLTPMEERASGAYDLMDKFNREKAGVHFLWRAGMQPYFNFYMQIPLDKVDFTGLKIRSTPAYDAIVAKLGGTTISTSMSQTYTALERNMIQGYGFPTLGINDHKLEEVTKYVWGPAFNASPTGVWVNLAKWDSLSQAQRDVLTEAGKEMEVESTEMYPDFVKKDREVIGKAGVKIYNLSPEQEKYFLKVVSDAAWEDTLKKAPGAAALRPLMTKK